MANKQHAQFSDENGNIYYLENQTEDVLDPSGKPLSDGGDLSEASVKFSVDTSRKLPQSGGRFKAFLGSIVKYLTDLGAAAYLAVANNDTTTQPGFVGDARVLKQHRDAINQLNSEIDCSGQISIENMWQLKISEVYTIGRMCYFNMSFSNGLNPSGNVERFASGFPLPIGNNVACVAFDYDNDVTLVAIPCVISSTGELLVCKPVDFQHTIICCGMYLIK